MADQSDPALGRSFTDFVASRWRSWSDVTSHPSIPTAPRTLALAGKVALDEMLLTAMIASVRLPAPHERRRIARETGDALALFDDRGWLIEPRRYHETPPPPERVSLRRSRSRGIEFRHLAFDSDYEPRPEEPGRARWLGRRANRRAHAWVVQHAGPPRPWLMCIHGYGMGIPFVDLGGFQAARLARGLGLNLIFPVLPLHGPRREGARSGQGFVSGDHLDTVHAEAQAMWDIRRILAWVRGLDGESVGVYGLSLGGYNAALLAGLEPDLACVIAGVPATCFVSFVREHSARMVLRDQTAADLMSDDAERILRVVSPLSLPPLVPWDRRFLFAGLADRFIPAEHVRRLWEHWSRSHVTWYHGTHMTFPFERQVQQLIEDALHTTGLIHRRPTPNAPVIDRASDSVS